jgi:hypothetical protein
MEADSLIRRRAAGFGKSVSFALALAFSFSFAPFSNSFSVSLFGAARAAVPVGGACHDDAQCEVGSICTDRVCTALPKRTRIIPFYWHQPGEVGYRHIVPLLYFHSWSRTGGTAVQFPFFARSYDRASQSTTTVIPPLLFSRTHSPTEDAWRLWPIFWYTSYPGQGAQAALLPLFWWSHRGPQRWFVAPLLLSGGQRNTAEDVTEAVVGLIGYYRRHRDDTWRVLAPLFFDHETTHTRTTVAPLAYFHREYGHRSAVLFPLFWHTSDEAKGTSHTLMIPLFDYESDHNGRHARAISPIGGYERDDDAGMSQLLLLVPPVYHRRDPARTVDVVPPLFTRWHVHADDSSGWLFGPLYHTQDHDGDTTAVVPIYWRFADRKSGATTHVIPPIAAFHQHPGGAGGFVGPIYGWRGQRGWGAGVAPLAFFGRRDTRRHALLLPLFAHFSDEADHTSTTVVGPTFVHRAQGGWDAGVVPILFAGRHADRSYAAVPPIFWHHGTADGTTDIAGPAYLYRGRRGWAFGLAPLVFAGNLDGKSHQVVVPLFFRWSDEAARRSQMLAGPFYHSTDGDTRVDVLFPLFYLRRAPGAGLLVSPLGGWRKDAARGTETVIVGPYLHRRNDRAQSSTHLLFPLGVVHRAPDYSVTVQFPLFWRVREKDETDTALFPFYWQVRSPRLQLDALFPLFLRWKSPAASTVLAGPLWYRARTDGGRSFVLFPLVAYGRDMHGGKPPSSWLGAPGIYWSKNERSGSENLVVGPFFRFARDNGYTAGFIPLAFAWRRGTASKVVTPIFYRQSDPAADRALNVLGPFYWGHSGETRRFGLVPLFFERFGPEGSSTTLLPLFYAAHKKDGGRILATPLFGYSRYATGSRGYVGPIYWRRDDTASSTALWPIFYHSRDHVTGSRTSFFIPLYVDARAADGRQLALYTPLVWRYRSVETAIHVGVPLFFDVHRFGESRTTGVIPLVFRNRSEVDDKTTWVIPPLLLWARHRGGEDPGTDAVFFPLIWHYGGRNFSTVAAPIFWDFKRGESRTTVVFPLLVHWRRPDAQHTIFLNMYYWRGVGAQEGGWKTHVIPLCSFGRPRKGDLEWDVLLGLFGYTRQGRNRSLKLFWFANIPLDPAPAAISWFGSTDKSARTEF